MNSLGSRIAFGIIAVVLGTSISAEGQDLDKSLQMFDPLIGKSWIGHYVGRDEELDHFIRWEPILNGKAVREIKDVPELGFSLERVYYYDWGLEQLSFLALTSRGFISRGSASLDEGRILLTGVSVRPDGSAGFRIAFEVTPEGLLQDRFYLKKGDTWDQRHLIEYSAKSAGADK